MITYNDTTYCVRECNNMQCKINIKHIEGQDTKGLPVSMAIFDKCENYKCNHIWEKLNYPPFDKIKLEYRCSKCGIVCFNIKEVKNEVD